MYNSAQNLFLQDRFGKPYGRSTLPPFSLSPPVKPSGDHTPMNTVEQWRTPGLMPPVKRFNRQPSRNPTHPKSHCIRPQNRRHPPPLTLDNAHEHLTQQLSTSVTTAAWTPEPGFPTLTSRFALRLQHGQKLL